MSNKDEVVKRLSPLIEALGQFLESPRRPFSALRERDVPETSGLYIIFKENPLEVLYVGIARTRQKFSSWGQPDGLRFRIMKNHLGYQGSDNFLKYLMAGYQLDSKSSAREYLRHNCSVHWLEVQDLGRLFALEHVAIAGLGSRLNRA